MSKLITEIKGGYSVQTYVSKELRDELKEEAAKRHRRIADIVALVMAEWLSGDRELAADHPKKLSTN